LTSECQSNSLRTKKKQRQARLFSQVCGFGRKGNSRADREEGNPDTKDGSKRKGVFAKERHVSTW
jgi:hypothetical protein